MNHPQALSPETLEVLFEAWRQARWLRPLDIAFAELLSRLSAETGAAREPLVALLAALTSHQLGRGHPCMDLDSLLTDPESCLALPPDEKALTPELRDLRPGRMLAGLGLSRCQEALAASPAVGDGSATTPLVLQGRRLYLRRFWCYEQRLAEGIHRALQQPSALHDADAEAACTLAASLKVLFPRPPEQPGSAPAQPSGDDQKQACALAARSRFAVITGGPGTGKTTTVVKLLAALQALAGSDPKGPGHKYRIQLAAPTGKAAARLNESIGGALSRLPLAQLPGEVTAADIPNRVTTLHRLLGSRPGSRRFRHHQDNPLLCDILVIDEASMVDLELMAAVFAALPDRAQLILLGDRDQLASVDAGAVLGELCSQAHRGGYWPETARWLRAVTGEAPPAARQAADGRPLDQAVALLRRSYRFREDSGIKQLASAVNQGKLEDDFISRCRSRHFADLAWLDTAAAADPQAEVCDHALSGSPRAFGAPGDAEPPQGYRQYLALMADARRSDGLDAHSPRAAWDDFARRVLAAFADFQLLCALRQGPWGVADLNQAIARRLVAEGLIPRAEGWYPGRPVLITANDYQLGLMNGDIGICFELPWGQATDAGPASLLRVAFPAADGSDAIRWIAPSRLQQLDTVYAMTVHKSQGSEFRHCCLVLPERPTPVLSRELLYTAITRARHWFSLVTPDPALVSLAAQRPVTRVSGLGEGLEGAGDRF